MMKFTIDITLGNELMRNATHVKDALHRVGQELHTDYMRQLQADSATQGGTLEVARAIFDINGNRVGEWKLSTQKG
jgi:hypothetical protein